MAFRSHVLRSIDPARRSHQAIIALVLLAAVSGLAATWYSDASRWLVIEAAGATFLVWMLGRELDPDRDATALVAAVAGGVWAVLGQPVDLLILAGLGVAARLVVESTGRRPLTTDLLTIAAGATLISLRPLGFVAGFGLAVAIYVDVRLSAEPSPVAVIVSVAAAAGAGVIASTAGDFPQQLPDLMPWLVASIAGLSLLAVLRDPPPPTSQVDSRRKSFLRKDRLHSARVLVGLLCLAGALLAGEEGAAVVPAVFCLGLALASSEVERSVRARL
jgi:hypothetical protein